MALKVYRTPIGFHDAYVAAPSQKAALKAWGSDADLFARGVAEMVTDDALTKEAMARPGEVIRKLRGSAEEQLAASPKAKRVPSKGKARPRPDRAKLDAAEDALTDAQARQRDEDRALDEERRKLRAAHQAEMAKLEAARDAADKAYAAKLKAWREA